MDVKSLKSFAVVAELGGISPASKALNSVRSNVTTRIKALEAELGIDLFYRSRSGMTLTSAGVAFLPYAQDVLQAMDRARVALNGFSDTAQILRLGSMETTLAVRLPMVIPNFRKAHPGVRLQIHSGPTDELVERVLKNQIDLAFIGGQFPHPQLKAHPIFVEEMVLASSKAVDQLEDLGSSTLIVFRQGCSYREFTRRWMRRTGLAPNDTFELGSLEGILGCVASGVGVTCLPRSVVEVSQYRETLNIHQLDDPERFIDTYAIEKKNTVSNGAIPAFLDAVQATKP